MKAETVARLQATAQAVPSIVELFNHSSTRSDDFTANALGLHFDFSRQRISTALWDELLLAAHDSGVRSKISRLFAGEKVNTTENRAALHVALRADSSSSAEAQWAASELERAKNYARNLRSRSDVHAIVNLGIGGSDLGPAMANRALRRFSDGPTVRYVSNVDAADLDDALEGLNPQHTVFIVSSKTFTTSETMHNAQRARTWLMNGGVQWKDHFLASTANPSAAVAWGIHREQCFEFKEWVGGRFSIASVIGLPLMCAIGPEAFDEFLLGMRDMDHHVATADVAENLAVVHALVWFANSVLHEYPTVAVVPYSHDLARLPAYLQQLVMESNGKSVDNDGAKLSIPSSPVVWGEPGTNGQHAFFQMLHQGTQVVPVEFLSSVASLGADDEAHNILIANMLAQSEALAVGAHHENSHQNFPGNRPSSVMLLDELSPRSLGALLSMYEHSTAVQGWLIGVNSFDQFGVELGKVVAGTVQARIANQAVSSGLTVTHPLLEWYLNKRNNN